MRHAILPTWLGATVFAFTALSGPIATAQERPEVNFGTGALGGLGTAPSSGGTGQPGPGAIVQPIPMPTPSNAATPLPLPMPMPTAMPAPPAVPSLANPANPLYSGGTGLPALPSLASQNSMTTLTSPTGLPQPAGVALPPGSVASPLHGSAGGLCCGPTGADGVVTYELYTYTGPSLILGGGPEFSGAATFGWMVTGGGRSLFFNPQGDAAWTLNLGGTYAYNGGNEDRILDVFSRAPRGLDGNPIGPDEIYPFRLRGITRTSFNYGLGRDWFLYGPGVLGYAPGWNTRFGVDVNGRWGTIRADLIPDRDRDNYLRRYSVTHGVSLGAHYDVEVPMGNWIFFTGARVEYGWNWSNIVPPLDGNFQDLNLLFSVGVRF